MKKLLIIIILLFPSYAFAQTGSTVPMFGQDQCIWFEEEDGSPQNVFCAKMKVANGSLTNNGDGSFSLTGGSGAPTDADYLVGTTNGSLSAEIVVGTTPGGELGNTWASPTLDDSVGVSSWNLTTPNILSKYDLNDTAVDDDDCTGEQGKGWYDSTDSAWEFCNANSGAPATLAAAAGDVTDVGDCATGACFTGASGTLLQSNTDLIMELDNDNNGTESFQVKDGADAMVAEIPESGIINTLVGFDGIGAVDLDYGSADITDHTFVTDGTGTGEIVLPDESISTAEITNGTITTTDISGSAGITAAQTALTAGRSLTLSTNDILADVELYTHTVCYRLPNPLSTDDDKSIWMNDTANGFTVTKLWCESDQTATIMLQVDDGTPADMDTVDLVCISTPDTDTSLDGDAGIAAGDRVDLDIASTASSPTYVSVCFTYTADD